MIFSANISANVATSRWGPDSWTLQHWKRWIFRCNSAQRHEVGETLDSFGMQKGASSGKLNHHDQIYVLKHVIVYYNNISYFHIIMNHEQRVQMFFRIVCFLICFCFSVWGTFPCYLLHFGAKTCTCWILGLNFAICTVHRFLKHNHVGSK